MTALGMDQGLVGNKGSHASLETIWKRYLTIIRATSKVGDVDWVFGSKKPSDSEIISVYSGKSSFYEQAKVLQHVKLYPDMVEWLERTDSDISTTTNLWGFYKMMYVLKDLEKWIGKKGEEGQKDRKGKKKVTMEESVSPSPQKKTKSHKKSAGGRKQ
ncbi:hypothetical protein BYT27DRAFT_6441316 [Phlegmacium glaucopus]|nr:hypothetical protein BYT27DRAFT_6441316 [Phlegmacium glaucopus]